jgi:hypothetical protein
VQKRDPATNTPVRGPLTAEVLPKPATTLVVAQRSTKTLLLLGGLALFFLAAFDTVFLTLSTRAMRTGRG